MISKRLKSLEKYIESNDSVIDIGCDHALLDIDLINNKIIDKIIVSDIHENALQAGIKNINKNRLANHIEPRFGDGLNVLDENDKVDTLLISGMGTNTILNILNNKYLKKIKKMIIQSNNDHSLLRSEITKLGFIIKDEEYLVDNNKNYINIVFVRGNKEYTKKELLYGPILIKNIEYLTFELNNCNKILKLIPNIKLKQKISLYKEILYLKKQIRRCKNG